MATKFLIIRTISLLGHKRAPREGDTLFLRRGRRIKQEIEPSNQPMEMSQNHENLRKRFKSYQAQHPVTVRGVARLAGIKHHQHLSSFISNQQQTVQYDVVVKLDNYLNERGF